MDVIGKFESFATQTHSSTKPIQTLLACDTNQKEDHIATEDEVDIHTSDDGLKDYVTWSKGGSLIKILTHHKVKQVLWTMFPAPFGRSLCILHDNGTVLAVYTKNGMHFPNPLLQQVSTIWSIEEGIVLQVAVPPSGDAASSPNDLLAHIIPQDEELSSSGNGEAFLFYIKHPLMLAQPLMFTNAAPQGSLQVLKTAVLPVHFGGAILMMDVILLRNLTTCQIMACALGTGSAGEDMPLSLHNIWQQSILGLDVHLHVMGTAQSVLVVVHYAASHHLQAYAIRWGIGTLAQSNLVLSTADCCGVSVLESCSWRACPTFGPHRQQRLLVVDGVGNAQLLQYLHDSGLAVVQTFRLPSSGMGTITGISNAVGLRCNFHFSSGATYRMQLKSAADCPLVAAALDTLRCILPTHVALALEGAFLRHLNEATTPERTSAAGHWGSTDASWAVFCNTLLPVAPSHVSRTSATSQHRTSEDDSWWDELLESGYNPPPSIGVCEAVPCLFTNATHNNAKGSPDLREYHLAILASLHLLYENCKLDVQTWPWLKPLACCLLCLARHLQLLPYCLHYCHDWPGLLLPDGQSMHHTDGPVGSSAVSLELCQRHIAYFAGLTGHSEVPHVYRWLRQCMLGDQRPFPVLRNGADGTVPPTDLTRRIGRLYDLLFHSNAVVYTRYEVSTIYDETVAKRHISIIMKERCAQVKAEDIDGTETCLSFPPDLHGEQSGSERVVLGMVTEGCTAATLDTLAFGVAQCLREALFECRNMPILSTNWPKEAYVLIGREDLAALASPCTPLPCNFETSATPIDMMTASNEAKTGCEVGDAGELGKLIWGDDGRLLLVQNMLSSSLPVRLHAPSEVSVDPLAEQQLQLQRIANRIFAISVGRGALTLSTIRQQPDSLPITPITVAGKRGKNEAILKLDITQLPANTLVWPEFHNGCAVGLRLKGHAKPKAVGSTGRHLGLFTRDWILYHFPSQPTSASAGMLFALGLQGHLSALALTDVYHFMKVRHDPTTIAVLLGLAATCRGTMTTAITSMLSLHLAPITPAYPGLEVSLPVQTAALIGVGFIYQGSSHRFMSELLLGELGRSPSDEHCTNREGYAWAAGVALGLVCLGKGTTAESLADLWLDDKLYGYMMGVPRADLAEEGQLCPEGIMDPDAAMDVVMRRRDPTHSHHCSRILEGRMVNVSVTGAGATMALMLMYLMTNNRSVAARLAVPQTRYLLDSVTPDAALLRVLACGMVMWDTCAPTEEWLASNVPLVIRSTIARIQQRTARNAAHLVDDDEFDSHTGGLSHTLLMYSHMLAGGILAMGIRFAGTERTDIRDIILSHLCGFMDAKAGNLGLSVLSATASRASMDSCVHAAVLAVACVMAGSGDYETLGVLRKLWKREEANYGQHMAVAMGLGLLFLGAGHCSLAKDAGAVAALLIACYPRFPTSASDNSQHLQALRHLYTLAAVPSMLETRDVDTGLPCYLPVQIHLKKGATMQPDSFASRRISGPSPGKTPSGKTRLSIGDANVRANQLLFTPGKVSGRLSPQRQNTLDRTAPCLMPPLDTVAKVVVKSPRYFPLTLEMDNELHLQALQRGLTIFVKRRTGFLSYFDDPKGVRNLLSSRTISSPEGIEGVEPGHRGVMPPLYSDPTTTLFATFFGGTSADPLFYRLAIQECLYNENTEMLAVYQWLYRSSLSVANPLTYGTDPPNTCHTSLMWNCRLIFCLYDTYTKAPRNASHTGAQRLESGRLLSLDLVKAMQVMMEEQMRPVLGTWSGSGSKGLSCATFADFAPVPSTLVGHRQSPLLSYLCDACFPTPDHLQLCRANTSAPVSTIQTPIQLQTLFSCAVQYYDLPTPAVARQVLQSITTQLLQRTDLTDEDRSVLMAPLITMSLPEVNITVIDLLMCSKAF